MSYTPVINSEQLTVVYPKLDNNYQWQTTEKSSFIMGQLKNPQAQLLLNQQPVETSKNGYFCTPIELPTHNTCIVFNVTAPNGHEDYQLNITKPPVANWQLNPPSETELQHWLTFSNNYVQLYIPKDSTATLHIQNYPAITLTPSAVPITHLQEIIFGYTCTPVVLPPLNAQWVSAQLPFIATASQQVLVKITQADQTTIDVEKTLTPPTVFTAEAFKCGPKNTKHHWTVLIDAGHGGTEDGAIAPNGTPEKHLNLCIAQHIMAALHPLKHIKAVATRTTDETVTLATRQQLAQHHQADLLVSIHHNALPDCADPRQRSGLATLYTHPDSLAAAQFFQHKLVEQTGHDNDGIFEQNLAVCRHNQCPSVLLELGYLTNPNNCEWILDPQHQQQLGKHIAHAISQYFNPN